MTPDQFEQWQAERRELELQDALRFLAAIRPRPRPKNELGRFEMLTVGDFEFLRQCGISID